MSAGVGPSQPLPDLLSSLEEVLQGPRCFLVSQPPPLCSCVWSGCLDDRRHPHPPSDSFRHCFASDGSRLYGTCRWINLSSSSQRLLEIRIMCSIQDACILHEQFRMVTTFDARWPIGDTLRCKGK